MNKAFEKILELIEQNTIYNRGSISFFNECDIKFISANKAKEIVQEVEEEYNSGWIPCNERLPEERDWYLAVFEEVDTGFIGIPYIADYLMGNHTKFTTEDGWIIHNCTDIEGSASEYYKKLRCVAWMPLPEPFKAETEGAE